METIDAGDIPLDDVVRELFSEEGLKRLLGRYDTACFVLARSGLQPQFYQEVIENIDTVDETTRDSIAFIVFHGNQSSYIRPDDYRYRFHLDGLSVSKERESPQRFDRNENAAFAPEFRHRIKTAPDRAPFSNIGRATDYAATLLMERFDVRETSLPCLLFVKSSRMDEPQGLQKRRGNDLLLSKAMGPEEQAMNAIRKLAWEIAPESFAATYCRNCAAGWTRTGPDGHIRTVCLLDRELVWADMIHCDRYERRDA
jgi:hypothetical protein